MTRWFFVILKILSCQENELIMLNRGKNLSKRVKHLKSQPGSFNVETLIGHYISLPTLEPDQENKNVKRRGVMVVNFKEDKIVALFGSRDSSMCTLQIESKIGLPRNEFICINQPYSHISKLVQESASSEGGACLTGYDSNENLSYTKVQQPRVCAEENHKKSRFNKLLQKIGITL